MEKATALALLEKYWQAETTIAEEAALAAYFCGGEVDAELLPYCELFIYFQEETQISAGPDFGDRILQRLGLPLDAEAAPVVPVAREPFRLGMAAAAAAILLVVTSLFLLKPVGEPAILADTRPTGQTASGAGIAAASSTGQGRSTERAVVTDTYDDPEQALAAVRHALLIASRNLNQGRRRLTGAHK
jgi:hypothetical protein